MNAFLQKLVKFGVSSGKYKADRDSMLASFIFRPPFVAD